MTGYLLIALTAICSLSMLLALIALSRGVADWLERGQCTCLFEPQAAVGTETDEDGSHWIVYPRCGMHGRQQRTRIYDETASGQTLAVR